MVTKEQYDAACKAKDDAQSIINQYYKEKNEEFRLRLIENPIFADDELIYSAKTLCPCGHGLARPKDCGPNHYWDCSAILKGISDMKATHTGRLPFAFYDIKAENEYNGTTRGMFKPQKVEG